MSGSISILWLGVAQMAILSRRFGARRGELIFVVYPNVERPARFCGVTRVWIMPKTKQRRDGVTILTARSASVRDNGWTNHLAGRARIEGHEKTDATIIGCSRRMHGASGAADLAARGALIR